MATKTKNVDLVNEPKNEKQLVDQVANIVEAAKNLNVCDEHSFGLSGEYLVSFQTRKKVVVTFFKPLKEATNKAHKAVTQREKDVLAPLTEADYYIRKSRNKYADEQEKKRQKEQDRLDALAKKKADRETSKLMKKAEEADDPDEKEHLEQKAQDVYVPPNIASGGMNKTYRHEGGGSTTFVKDIEVDVTDVVKLLTAIVAGHVPLTVVEIKPAKLKAYVKANDIKNGQVQGIRIRETKRESVRGR